MDDAGDQLLEALASLDDVAGAVAPDEAAAAFDDASLEVFWREWPRVSAWAGALWRLLDQDLAQPSSPFEDPEVDEVGGEGG